MKTFRLVWEAMKPFRLFWVAASVAVVVVVAMLFSVHKIEQGCNPGTFKVADGVAYQCVDNDTTKATWAPSHKPIRMICGKKHGQDLFVLDEQNPAFLLLHCYNGKQEYLIELIEEPEEKK